MKVINDTGDVHIGALEDLARQRRPEISFLSIPTAIGHQTECPVLLFPAQDVDQAYVFNGLVINM